MQNRHTPQNLHKPASMDQPPPYTVHDTNSRHSNTGTQADAPSQPPTAKPDRRAILTLPFYKTTKSSDPNICTLHIQLVMLYGSLTICPHMSLSHPTFPAHLCHQHDPLLLSFTAWSPFACTEKSNAYDCKACHSKAWLSRHMDTGLLSLHIERVWNTKAIGQEGEKWLTRAKTEVWNAEVKGGQLEVVDDERTKLYTMDRRRNWNWPIELRDASFVESWRQ